MKFSSSLITVVRGDNYYEYQILGVYFGYSLRTLETSSFQATISDSAICGRRIMFRSVFGSRAEVLKKWDLQEIDVVCSQFAPGRVEERCFSANYTRFKTDGVTSENHHTIYEFVDRTGVDRRSGTCLKANNKLNLMLTLIVLTQAEFYLKERHFVTGCHAIFSLSDVFSVGWVGA